jgi:transcriptional regulator with XRE-family HTH domain
MKKEKPTCYLRSYRRRWGLSQKDLAYLLGLKSEAVVSRIEKKLRRPSLKVVIGCFIIFGTSAVDLFPGISQGIEDDVMARVWELYERTQGHPTRRTKMIIELLEDVIGRAEQRRDPSDV